MDKSKEPTNSSLIFESGIINSIRSNGRSKNPEDVNSLEFFYEKYKCVPFIYKISSSDEVYFDWSKIRIKLKELYPEQKFLYREMNYDLSKNLTYSKQDIIDYDNGIIGIFNGGVAEDYYLVNYDTTNIPFVMNDNMFLVKDEFKDFEKVSNIFKECILEKSFSITIGMVSYDNGNFYVKDFDIKNKTFCLNNLDLHYGDGFETFTNELLNRINNDTKGLTLFHGLAGTGKCVTCDTKIKIRNKKTGIIEEINIEDLM